MSINFPASPNLNDTYSFGGKTWIWNGQGWALTQSGNTVGLTTDIVVEANNLYFTVDRVNVAIDSRVTANFVANLDVGLDTDDVDEATNLYYTNARVNSFVTPSLTTANVIELTNLYYTNARVEVYLADGGYQTAANIFANITLGSNISGNTTTDLAEGINLYYTNTRVNSFVTPKLTTANVIEFNNLYYTDDRANTAIDNRVTKSFVENLNLEFVSNAHLNTALVPYVTDTELNVELSSYATLTYVDEVAEGLRTKPAVELATVAHLEATYDNGNAGIGATLTANVNSAFPTIDGVTITSTILGQNGVLVKNQNNRAHNGRYNLTTVGNVSAAWVLTRCALCDEADEIPGAFTFVKAGNVNAGTGWVQVVDDPSTFIVGTDIINVFQFSATAGTLVGNVGISVVGDQIFNTGVITVNSANGFVTLTTTEIGEGANLYFTNARARLAVSQGSGVSYNDSTGVISANVTSVAGRTGAVVLTNSDISGLTTANVAELTNLYYTNARVSSSLTSSDIQVRSLGVNTAASGTAGEIRATNNITAYFSDKRLKTVKGNIKNPIDKLKSLSGVMFVNNDVAAKYGYTDQSLQVGVIAQEVESVLPEAVVAAPFDLVKDEFGVEKSSSGENYLTVRYEKLIPLLIEAIKDQQKQIDELKKKHK
jgi:hypothetical protein